MTFALQVLIASSVFCVVIITIFLLQKRDYLKHKFFTILMLCSSLLFLIASSAYFYYEYPAYLERKKRYGKTSNINQKLDDYRFNNAEIDLLGEFSQAKNTLIGYEKFLEESAQAYNPDDFSYENLLKEKLISQFENKEYNLEYWNDVEYIVAGFYENTKLYNWDRFPIAIIPSDKYEEVEFQNDAENEHIEFYSKLTYVQRKIKTFDRSSERIEGLWSKNKVFIYTILTKAKYNKIAKTVDNLITVHNRIIQEQNYKEFYTNHNLYTNDDYYDEVFLSYPSKEIVDSFNNNWLFGFWDRRFEENNDQTVYKILKEIQAHYKD